jgi:CheY-like chemotaxis protein
VAEGSSVHAEATANAVGPLVVVVDDQPFFRAYLRNELARRGHTVLTAENAREAEKLVDELGPPLVLVLDLVLPGTSGAELLHTLARRPEANSLRFILVSAHPVLKRVAPNHKLVVGRLEKPVNLARLTEQLTAAGVALRERGP